MERSSAREGADTKGDGAGDREHPLPLSLDFMFGRGYLWAEDVEINDWLQLDQLRMEIPDLSFPFDAGGGIGRFQHTRCQVREVELSIRESALEEMLRRTSASNDAFRQLSLTFLEGAAHVALQLRSFGVDTYLSMRAALLPPEPPQSDEVHLSLYDYRPFGPLPYPARVLAHELLTGILDRTTLSAPGRGEAFRIGVAGDIATLRPFKLLFAHLFPRRGWKLPSLAGVVVDDVRIRPGRLTIRASSREGDWGGGEAPSADSSESPPEEARRALAAYEAKDLFAPADEALFDGEIPEALDRLSAFRDRFGLSPHLAARLLDGLLADPTTRHAAEARSICRELEGNDSAPLLVHWARILLARLSREEDEVRQAYGDLIEHLRARGDTRDRVLAELTLADLIADAHPERAARRLREVLEVAPRNRSVLEHLRDLYEQLGERDGLEDVLRRLAGLYTASEPLLETYRALGRHLMNREGELAEARHYLRQALEIDSEDQGTLVALGRCHALADKPLRAVKAFGAASRQAENRGNLEEAHRLHARIAELWHDELDEPEEALLSMRRALPEERVRPSLDGGERARSRHADRLARAARLCEEAGRTEEALGLWSDLVSFLDHALERRASSARPEASSLEERLAEAHRRLASLYNRRERHEATAHQWQRLLELEPDDEEAFEQLRSHYRTHGRPDRLRELLEGRIERVTRPTRKAELQVELADWYEAMEQPERAEQLRAEARALDPSAASTEPEPDTPSEPPDAPDASRERRDSESNRPSTRTAESSFEEPTADPIRSLDGGDGDASSAESDGREETPPERRETLEIEAFSTSEEGEGPSLPHPSNLESPEASSSDDAPDGSSAEPESEQGFEEEPTEELTPLHDREDTPHPSLGEASSAADEADEASTPETEGAEPEGREEGEFLALDYVLDEPSSAEHESDELEAPEPDESFGEPAGAEAPDPDDPFGEPAEEDVPAPDAPFGESAEVEATAADEPFEPPSGEEVADPGAPFGEPAGAEAPDPDDPFGEPAEEDVPAPDAPFGEPDAADVPEAEDALDRLELARRDGTPEERADAMADVVEAYRHDASSVPLSESDYYQMMRDLGELLYFELEHEEEARTHLERLRREDPEGVGGDHTVLTILESVYEDHGATDDRISLLETRLERADTEEMETTYRLLLAQLHWEERGDRDAAERHLERTLEIDPDHEGAHRLMAEMAREAGDDEQAARHLEALLEVSDAGLDAVSVERQLADLLLRRLERPRDAATHYERVLRDAPGDTEALEGLEACQMMLGDWSGYVESLGRELGLLIGDPDGLTPEEMAELDPEDVGEGGWVPASQLLADAAEILDAELSAPERAHRLLGVAHRLWPENAEALERRIQLDRDLGQREALAEDLAAYADCLLDPAARVDALVESAQLHCDVLDDSETARSLVAESLRALDDSAEPPQALVELRERLFPSEDGAHE